MLTHRSCVEVFHFVSERAAASESATASCKFNDLTEFSLTPTQTPGRLNVTTQGAFFKNATAWNLKEEFELRNASTGVVALTEVACFTAAIPARETLNRYPSV